MRNLASVALVKKVRKSLDLSQERFAHKLEVSKGAVQHWESGRSRPSPRILKQMAGLAPSFSGDLRIAVEQFEWHSREPKSRRYSEEAIAALHEMLDMILDNARSTVVEKITEKLEHYAGDLSSPPDRREIEVPPISKRKARRPTRA